MGVRQVGVSELRQSLSRYLRRVERGEHFEITRDGRPVAVLEPVPEGRRSLARLVSEGRILPPTRDISDLPLPVGRPSRRASDALLAQRAERDL